MVDGVSNMVHLTWDQTLELNIIYFLNVCAYIHDKNEWQAKKMKALANKK